MATTNGAAPMAIFDEFKLYVPSRRYEWVHTTSHDWSFHQGDLKRNE